MLDGVPPHYHKCSPQQLHHLFTDLLIDIETGNNAQYNMTNMDIIWLPRSPYFNPCDTHLTLPKNEAESIRQTLNLLQRTWKLLHHRMEKCNKVDGATLNNFRSYTFILK